MLIKLYPEHNWLPWKFSRSPRGLSENKDTVRNAIDYIEKELSIKNNKGIDKESDKERNKEMWYRISKSQLTQLGVDYIIQQNGGLFKLLKEHRPNEPWDESKFK